MPMHGEGSRLTRVEAMENEENHERQACKSRRQSEEQEPAPPWYELDSGEHGSQARVGPQKGEPCLLRPGEQSGNLPALEEVGRSQAW